MFLSKDEFNDLTERIRKLEKNLACYGRDITKEGEYVLNGDKLSEHLREIEQRQAYHARDGQEQKHLTAEDIIRRFNELYAILELERIQEPYGALRKRK